VDNLQEALPRALAPIVEQALAAFPVVIVTGARQTGKSTLVQMTPLANGRRYLSLDDYDLLERARREPAALLRESERLTIDEVQRATELLRAIKIAVDRDRTPGRFLLTGSANLLKLRRVSESLAGRAIYLTLWPMTAAEQQAHQAADLIDRLLAADGAEQALAGARRSTPASDWRTLALRGGYPVAALQLDDHQRLLWFDGYVRTYLERDLQQVATISALVDFRRLMRLAALRLGQLCNQTELGRDAGVSQPTTHRYLNLLETSYQLVRLPGYAMSRSKRLIKAPKLYWSDTGLAAFLVGVGAIASDDRLAGAWLENLVLDHLLSWRETRSPRPELFFWRTAAGHEVDFVVESGRRLLPLEVKAAQRVGLGDAGGLERFLDEHTKAAPFGVILHDGDRFTQLTQRVIACPVAALFAGGKRAR